MRLRPHIESALVVALFVLSQAERGETAMAEQLLGIGDGEATANQLLAWRIAELLIQPERPYASRYGEG